MKRSTIILVISLIVLSALPIILIKMLSSYDIENNIEGIEAAIRSEKGSLRYILIEECDSIPMDIHITTVPASGHPNRVLLNGEVYNRDTMLLTSNGDGRISLVYEENLSLIIENRNRQATFYFDSVDVNGMILSSCGDVNIANPRIGTILVTDSLGIGRVNIGDGSIGLLVSSRRGEQQLHLQNCNVGRWYMQKGATDYTYNGNCNIGMMITGDKNEVVVGSSDNSVRMTVSSEELLIGPEEQQIKKK